jgi:hypothetical protein
MTGLLIRQLWHFPQWLGELLGYRGHHSVICQRAFSDMLQPADFDGFYNEQASNLLAYGTVMAAISQRSPQPLREALTLANGLDAEW